MFLAGLPLGTLLGIGAGTAILVVFFYVLRLRRRPVPVPFARIWERVLRDKEATNLFAQLKRLLSLLLQLILLALLLFALGNPRLEANLLSGRNLVVLIDASASMKATDVTPNRLEAAKAKVRAMVQGLGSSDRMLIARMDALVTPLSTMTGETPALDQALNQLQATDTRADLQLGMRFALDSLRGVPNAEIVLVGDGAYGDLESLGKQLDLGQTRLSFVPVGQSQDNLALTAFSVRRYPLDKARYEVMLEVTNTTEQSAEAELSLMGDGQLVDVTRLKLAPKERLPRFYTDLSGAGRTLEARLKVMGNSRDYLPADDHAYALMPERRRSRILVVSPGNTYLEAALLLDEYLEVTTLAPEKYPPAGSFDVTIFDNLALPLAKQSGAVLYLNPPDGNPLKHGPKLEMFGFDSWDKKSPVLRWMELGDVQVAEGWAFQPEAQDRVLGRSEEYPILVGGRREGKRFLALGFDPRKSDFVLRVGWPLFLLNTINDFVEEDTSYVSSFNTGEVWQIPAPLGQTQGKLREPNGQVRTIPLRAGRAVTFGEQAGFYELALESAPETTKISFAANMIDPEESRIGPHAELTLGKRRAEAAPEFTLGVRRELWLYILLAAVGLSLIEWFTYHRRVTV